MTDNAALLARAVDQANSVIAAIPAVKAHAPTPCIDFDVTQLVQHVTLIADRVSTAIAAASAQPSMSWEQAWARLRPLLDTAAPDRVVDLPFGRMPLGAALGVFVGEFVTHAWDLAVAIGRADLLSTDLGMRAFAMARARIPRLPRTGTPFKDVVPVHDDAPVYDRLAGWMGRDPAW